MDTCDVAVLGAGPYGVSVAAHLRQAKINGFAGDRRTHVVLGT